MHYISIASLVIVATILHDFSKPVEGYKRKFREHANDDVGKKSWKWSNWATVMKPNGENDKNWVSRDGGYGLRTNAIRSHFPRGKYDCGVYEVRATKKGSRPKTVYVGSTCRSKRSLFGMIHDNRSKFLSGRYNCSVYEIPASKNGESPTIVYAGNNCRTKRAVYERIREYTSRGSHKKDLIKQALADGYQLEVRAKASANRKRAENEENELLAKYDYAWNVRNNGKIRQILHG